MNSRGFPKIQLKIKACHQDLGSKDPNEIFVKLEEHAAKLRQFKNNHFQRKTKIGSQRIVWGNQETSKLSIPQYLANVYGYIRSNFKETYICSSEMTNLTQKNTGFICLFDKIMILYLKPSPTDQLQTACKNFCNLDTVKTFFQLQFYSVYCPVITAVLLFPPVLILK